MSHLPRRCRTLLVALACDAVVGELPNQLHPVVWMDRWLKILIIAGLVIGGMWVQAASDELFAKVAKRRRCEDAKTT